jgi:hypothetical protein
MKLRHDTEIKTLEKTHQREKLSLAQRKLELMDTVWSLKVSAAFIHLIYLSTAIG